jgi:hypothetical protein
VQGAYYLLECFPTATWRSSGLVPLPAKRRRPDTAAFWDALVRRYDLPAVDPAPGHDDLQAVVAALVAAAVLGGVEPIPHGLPALRLDEAAGVPRHRVEGIIWDARPLRRGRPPS